MFTKNSAWENIVQGNQENTFLTSYWKILTKNKSYLTHFKSVFRFYIADNVRKVKLF